MSDEKKRSGLTYSQRERIHLDVLLGIIPPANESLEAAEERRIATNEVRETLDKGGQVSFPTDWDADDEEATVEASEPDKGSGGIPGGDNREPVDPPGVDAFRPETDEDERESGVNGIGFAKHQATIDYSRIKDVPGLDDTPLPESKPWMHVATGAVIKEADGRIWVVAPKSGWAGYHNTFPKGTVDDEDGLTMQQSAHREVYEESGLRIRLTGYVGDFASDQSMTRYYLAERVGGSPYHHDGKETAAVKLATPEQLRAMLNKKRDKTILRTTLEKFTTAGTTISAASPLGRAIKPKRDDLLNISKWKKVGGSLGSNPGGLYEDDSGERWYVKHSKSDDHARNEVLAAALYKAAGSPVLDYHLTKDASGKLGTATPWVDKKPFDPNSPAASTKVQAHFATHAWLANWDAVGLVFDNQAVVGGKMTTLDTGGALRYRAQGSPKLFGEHPTEWSSLRDSAKNPQAAAVFGKMTEHQLADSAAAVASVPDEEIDELVKKFGPTDSAERTKLATTLKVRKRAIKRNAVKEAAPANPAALPPPVKVKNVAQAITYQSKFDAVHAAATTLSPANAIAKISATGSNPNSKVTWGKKFHAYKTLVLAALGAGPGKQGIVAAPAVKLPSAPAAPPRPAFDPKLLPPPPTYTASSKAHVNAENTEIMKKMWEAAKSGVQSDVTGMQFQPVSKETGKPEGNLKPFSDHPAAPVKDYYNLLAKNIHDQLTPPPPQTISEPNTAPNDSSLFAAILSAQDENWLGNSHCVQAIVALYVEACFVAVEKRSEDEITEAQLQERWAAAELNAARILLGEDPSHRAVVGWNQPGGIDAHIATVLRFGEADPTKRVRMALRQLWHEISGLTVQEMQGMPLENTRWQMDLAVSETVRLFLGREREQDQPDA